jgi:pyruvate/2-oxoglutarate dehydrogenase complex dihydrolipoamide dehydrogenase (E3) component
LFDLVVVGGGPAGVSAALRARELGATVALAERDRLGGVCTNDGCVPTRVMAHAARLLRDARQSARYGLVGATPEVDFAALLARVRGVVDEIHGKKQLARHLERSGTELLKGAARFVGPDLLEVGERRIQASRFVLTCGGHARRLPFPGSELALTHSEIWSLERLPATVTIIGASATGSQLASIFEALGSQVHLLDLAQRILPVEDEAVSAALADGLAARGVELRLGIAGVERIERVARSTKRGPGLLRLHYREGDRELTVESELVVMAVGWPGNVDDLGLDAAGVRTERGYVVVDEELRTSVPGIYAAGDVTGRMMLVQSATYEARIAAENAVTAEHLRATHGAVPHGGFTDPEYGGVGLTETQARQQEACAVAVVPYADLDRAVIDDRREGFFKLIVARSSRRILGAHVVGEQATEVAQLVAAAMAARARVEALAQLELAYPTFTAIVGLAARQLVRELGVVKLAPAWRALLEPRAAEWERSGE